MAPYDSVAMPSFETFLARMMVWTRPSLSTEKSGNSNLKRCWRWPSSAAGAVAVIALPLSAQRLWPLRHDRQRLGMDLRLVRRRRLRGDDHAAPRLLPLLLHGTTALGH